MEFAVCRRFPGVDWTQLSDYLSRRHGWKELGSVSTTLGAVGQILPRGTLSQQ